LASIFLKHRILKNRKKKSRDIDLKVSVPKDLEGVLKVLSENQLKLVLECNAVVLLDAGFGFKDRMRWF